MEPWREIVVTDAEYRELLSQRLIYTGAEPPPLPPAFSMAQYDELNARAMSVRKPRGPRFGQLGDSIVAMGDGLSTQYFRMTVGHLVAAKANDRLHLVRNAGVAGNTLQQMIDRFAADVLPYDVHVLWIHGGVNDEIQGVSFADYQSRIRTLVKLCVDNEIVPIFSTITPVDAASAGSVARYKQWNTWLKAYCARNGIRCADTWAAATAGVRNGQSWPDGTYTTDGQHPKTRGMVVMARAILAVIQDLPQAPPSYALRPDAGGLGPANNHMLTNASGKVTTGWTWTTGGSPTSPAYAIVDMAGVPGKAQQITINETGSKSVTMKSADVVPNPADFSPGDRIRFSARASIVLTNLAAGQSIRLGMAPLQFRYSDGSRDCVEEITVGEAGVATDYGTFFDDITLSCEFTARDGDAAWLVSFTVDTGAGAGATGGAGVVRIAAPQITNLTRSGLA